MAIDKNWVLSINEEIVTQYGGTSGVRDYGLLESALNRADTIRHYKPTANIFELVASVSYSLIKNHPFFDGNKRVGFVVCEAMLAINDYKLEVSQDEKYQQFMAVASGVASEENLAQWLETKATKLAK
ncbi:type II toxin-antitoxin system death-on-curing family toxin [Deferribacterales bacterium RsTz2092]|nr:death-on-curing protein [Deferribacterales bacterium]